MVIRVTIGIVGVLVILTGVVFFGQGIDVIHGSSMSGRSGYAALGALLVVIGLGLMVWARRGRPNRTT